MHHSVKVIVGILLFLLLVSLVILFKWFTFLNTPLLKSSEDIIYQIPPGDTLNKLAYDLQQKGFLKKAQYFILLGKFKHQTKTLRSGEYRFVAGSTPLEVIDQLNKRKVIQYPITFVEGTTFGEMRHKIAEDTRVIHHLSYFNDQQLMKKLGLPEQRPEGLFFPDTYFIERNTSDIDLFKRAYSAMQQKVNSQWLNRAENLPYKTSYDAIIVASLVEKESALPQERAIIAGVILQRLQKNMLLQIDPTVIYGMGDNYIGRLTKKDLKKDNPYNTYRRRGLPPTPIALPSEQSLYAALHPQYSNYYYYVAKGDGSHCFSTTLKEQEEAIKRYLRR